MSEQPAIEQQNVHQINDEEQGTNDTFANIPNQNVNNQAITKDDWNNFAKELKSAVYQQIQSTFDKNSAKSKSEAQTFIDQFKQQYGVTLTADQAKQMAQNKQNPGADVRQSDTQTNVDDTDKDYERFVYYHGIEKDAPAFHECYKAEQAFGIRLFENDPEYQELVNPTEKYQNQESFVKAWRSALKKKLLRTDNEPSNNKNDNSANPGAMTAIGNRGNKSTTFDPNKKSSEYLATALNNFYSGQSKSR